MAVMLDDDEVFEGDPVYSTPHNQWLTVREVDSGTGRFRVTAGSGRTKLDFWINPGGLASNGQRVVQWQAPIETLIRPRKTDPAWLALPEFYGTIARTIGQAGG